MSLSYIQAFLVVCHDRKYHEISLFCMNLIKLLNFIQYINKTIQTECKRKINPQVLFFLGVFLWGGGDLNKKV